MLILKIKINHGNIKNRLRLWKGLLLRMNSAGGRCHDNARCESMWTRMKEELFYSRNHKTEDYSVSELKSMVWRYFIYIWEDFFGDI